ncbi:hypothetical protein BH24ACT3_BH24ACT3_02620 [soil metagenome]
MTTLEPADRYDRERSFHDDRFAEENRGRAAKYYEIDAGRGRYREAWRGLRPAAAGCFVLTIALAMIVGLS